MIFGRATYPVQRLPVVIPIGIQTETGVEEIAFDVSAWLAKWPDIEVEVWHRLPGQAEAYLTKSRREENIVYWEVSGTDTQIPGTGRVELMGTTATGRKLSGSTGTRIRETICASTQDPPDAPPTWVDTVREMVGGLETSDGQRMLPIVFIDGEIPTTKTETLAELTYRQGNDAWHAYLKIKCQGTSSMSYPKKNFTIKMYEDEARTKKKKVAFDIFGGKKTHKYTLKADWVDSSHARNVVNARIWGDVVASREDYASLPAELRNSPNNGAVNGFPVLMYANGACQGLYNWDISKDALMWGMDEDNPNHVLLCAEINSNGDKNLLSACNFRALWLGVGGGNGGNWSVEVGEYSEAIKDALNALISCVKDTDDSTFRETIGSYLDIQSAMDYYLYQYVIMGSDNLAKNMLLATYDLKKWHCGAYDLDATIGAGAYGSIWFLPTARIPEDAYEPYSMLWERLEKCFADELQARYAVLRRGALSVSNLIGRYEQYIRPIGADLYAEDKRAYSKAPTMVENDLVQIREYIATRVKYVDDQIAALPDNPWENVDYGENPIEGIAWTAGSYDINNGGAEVAIAGNWRSSKFELQDCQYEINAAGDGLTAFTAVHCWSKYSGRYICGCNRYNVLTGITFCGNSNYVYALHYDSNNGMDGATVSILPVDASSTTLSKTIVDLSKVTATDLAEVSAQYGVYECNVTAQLPGVNATTAFDSVTVSDDALVLINAWAPYTGTERGRLMVVSLYTNASGTTVQLGAFSSAEECADYLRNHHVRIEINARHDGGR